MAVGNPCDVTTLLDAIKAGDADAPTRLIERIYAELRDVAAGLMRIEPHDHTLQPTALLHEALGRLLGDDVIARSPDRAYLFAAAARAMRQVLVDHARQRRSAKRGGGKLAVPLDRVLLYFDERQLDVIAVHDALDRLAELNERQSRVVALRFFGGFTVAEIAEQLEVSVSTVEGDFRLARAWLRRELGAGWFGGNP